MKIRIFFLLFATLQGFSQLASSEVILNDPLESSSLTNNTSGFTWVGSADTLMVSHPAKAGDTGKKALQFSYPAGSYQSEQRFDLGKAYPEIWIRYWLQVPVNFKHNHPAGLPTNNKLFALWMDGYSAKGLGPSVIWEFWEDGNSGSELAVHYSEGNYTIAGEHLQGQPFIAYPRDQGRWMQILLHVRAASKTGANDGLIETYRRWDNENKFTQLHKVENINIAPPAGGPTGWKAGYFMGWSNPAYAADTFWFVNDVEMSTTSLLSLTSKPNFPEASLLIK